MIALGRLRNEALKDEVQRIVRAARHRAPVEDSRVELKREIELDPERAAGQIAGHANAAQGDHILWVIGLDENGQVHGATKAELSKWYPSVKRRFDGPAPSLTRSVSVPIDGKTVLAVIFGTGDFPYVIKRRDGRKDVAWREGTGTRSACRSELVGMLRQQMHIPDVDVLACNVRAIQDRTRRSWHFQAEARLYIRPALGSRPIVIPRHRCCASIRIPRIVKEIPLAKLSFSLEIDQWQGADFVVRRASALRFWGSATVFRARAPYGKAELHIVMEPAGWSVPFTACPSGQTHVEPYKNGWY